MDQLGVEVRSLRLGCIRARGLGYRGEGYGFRVNDTYAFRVQGLRVQDHEYYV